MSQISAAPLRTTYWVFQIGSKLARSACGTKRSVRAAARWEIAGVASPLVASAAAVFRNALRCMVASHLPTVGATLVVARIVRRVALAGPAKRVMSRPCPRSHRSQGTGRPQGSPLHHPMALYTALLTPQKNGRGPCTIPLTFLRQAWYSRKKPVGA